MTIFAFTVTFFSLVLAVSAVPIEVDADIPHNDHFIYTNKCVPKEQFIDQCNTCTCDPNGNGAICTRMNCPEPERPRIDGYEDGLACAPGKIFYDGCKSCTCAESGVAAECEVVKDCENTATRRLSVGDGSAGDKPAENDAVEDNAIEDNTVPSELPKFPHIDNFHETGKCNPGEMFYHECNTCHCSADGKGAGCTLMACPGYKGIRIDNYVNGNKCPANKTFEDKCNTCTCSADGFSAACTLMMCYGFE